MKHYLDEENSAVTTSIGLNKDVFGDIETFVALTEMRDLRQNWWEGIGPGGSISARAHEHNGRVYVGACDGVFYCLDMDGNEIWRFNTNGIIYEGCDVSEKEGVVYFGCSAGILYALDMKTGLELWRFKTNDKIIEKPHYHEGRLYVGGCMDQNFYCLDAKNGKEIWRFAMENGTVGNPAFYNNRIYCGYSDYNFYCLDMDGNMVWNFKCDKPISAWPPVVESERVYFGSWDCHMYCLDTDGNLKWKFSAPHPVMAPHYWDGKIYFGCWDNNVYCIDAENGDFIWKYGTNGFASGSFGISNNTVFTGSTDNNVYAIDAVKGKLLWKFKTNGMIIQMSVFDDRIYASSWDCNLYCIDKDGNLLWKFHTSLSSPSKITPPESMIAKTAEFVWQPEMKIKKKSTDDEITIVDYGEFSGAYIDTTKTDYLGLKKKGYIK